MTRLTQWIRSYFGFSQLEIKGFFVLIMLLSILLIAPFLFPASSNYTAQQQHTDQQMLDSMRVLLAHQQIREKKEIKQVKWSTQKDKQVFPKAPINYFAFDPNTASAQDFEKLGLAPYLAKRIVKYRQKGGQFRKKEDVLKIYGFPKSLYTQWEPFIRIASNFKTPNEFSKNKEKSTLEEETSSANQSVTANPHIEKKPKRKFIKKTPQTFQLATADTSQLKQIRGIGSKLSARIVKFRDRLGGFHSFGQLHEVYGLKPEVIEELQKYAQLDQFQIKKLNINTAEAKVLAQHPYISYKYANVMVSYREQHGPYASLEDLKKIKIIKQEFIDKIGAYLEF